MYALPLILAIAETRLRRAYSAVQRLSRATSKAALAALLFLMAAKYLHKLGAEVGGGVLVLVGIAQWSIPSALIVGGLAVVGAVEARSAPALPRLPKR